MAESSGARSTKESHSSVSSSGEASGGQKASPQSSLVLTPQYTEDAGSSPAKVTITSPGLPTNVLAPLAAQNAPSSSDTPSPVARRAHITDSAANLADSEGESKQEGAVKQSKLTKSFLSRFRQKNAEMHKIFRDLPKTEKLIDDYSCALHREILAQGRMYITQSYLCFYANIFTWETLLVIPLNRIKSVTKEKRALLFPTAIHVTTATDKYGFSSFIQRDVSYQILFRLWQNALLNQPLSPVELYKIARKNWGDPHTFSTEDDTWGYPQPLNPSHGKSEMLEDEKEDPLMMEGEAEGNSHEGLSGEGDVANREDPSSDSSAVRVRAHSLPEGHARTGRQVVAVSSQGNRLQPYSLTTVSKVITTMTTSNASSNGVWEGTGGARERMVSTIPAFCGDHGRSSGATGAAFAGAGRNMGSVGGASCHSPQQPPEPSGNSGAVGDTDSCLSHPVLIIRDGTDYHSVSESVLSSEFETTSFLDQGEVLCGCEIHEGCTVINDVYDADIETIFQVLFTDSEFMKNFLHSRGTTNIDFGEWFAHVDGSRVRDMKYTIALNYSFGPKFSPSTERQVYSKVSQPGLRHIVESEVCNGNVPYNDKFYTCVRVCMTRVTHSQTRIRVTSNIAFRKNCWGVVKNLIERNVGDGLRSHYAHLDMTLKEHVTSLALKKKVPHKGSSRRARKQRRQLSSVPWESNGASMPPPRGHHSRKPSLTSTGGYPAAENITDPALLTHLSTHSSHADLLSSHQGGEGTASPPLLTNRFTVWLLLFVASLVVCNMGLYYWLMRYQPGGPPSPPTRATGGETPVLDKWPTSPEDWMSFVQDIQHRHRQQLKGYELLVTKLLDALKQMETDLARYHGTASQLLLDVHKEVPLPPTEQAIRGQGNQRDPPTETPLEQEL